MVVNLLKIPNLPINVLLFYSDGLIKLYLFNYISGMLSKKQILIVPLVFALVDTLFYPLRTWLGMFYLLATCILLSQKPKLAVYQVIFFSLFPLTIFEIYTKILYWMVIFFTSITADDIINSPFLQLAILFFITILAVQLVKFLNIKIDYIQESANYSRLKNQIIILNIAQIVFLSCMNFIQTNTPPLNIPYLLILPISLVLIIRSLTQFSSTILIKRERELRQVHEVETQKLIDYNKQIEELYRGIKSFRHDYLNLLISLENAIFDRDIDKIQNLYDKVLKNTKYDLYNDKYEIGNLININNEAIKSLLSHKVRKAKSMDIKVNIEVLKEVSLDHIDTHELVQIIAILMDNAIEASVLTSAPEINITCLELGKQTYINISNSTLEEKIHLKQIYEYGFSTKGLDRGIGLANVRQILDKYPFASLSTKSDNYIFEQELILSN